MVERNINTVSSHRNSYLFSAQIKSKAVCKRTALTFFLKKKERILVHTATEEFINFSTAVRRKSGVSHNLRKGI